MEFLHFYRQLFFSLVLVSLSTGCSTLKKVFPFGGGTEVTKKPISYPFGDFQNYTQSRYPGIVVREKKTSGGTTEVELPAGDRSITDLSVPLSGIQSGEAKRRPAQSSSNIDDTYYEQTSGITDHEITETFSKPPVKNEWKQRDIEKKLGLVTKEDLDPQDQKSYLASVDRIKQLFRLGRYEAALIDLDHLVKLYPTAPQLYEMRGTLLSRLGYKDLAIKSWSQALELDPENRSLRNFLAKVKKKAKAREPASL